LSLWIAAAEETSITDPTSSEQDSTTAHINDVPVANNDDKNKNVDQKKALDDDGPTAAKDGNLNETENYSVTVIDVNSTIEEVEQILAANPGLPQLSRSEILEILENITTQNQSVVPEGGLGSGSDDAPVTQISFGRSNVLWPETYRTHEEYLRAMKALMVVLPYNAKNLSESKIQELYTKAPIIRFIAENSEVETTTTIQMKPSIATTILTTTTTEQPQHNEQQTKYPNHHEVYHLPYNSQPIHPESNYNHESETKTTATLRTEQSSTTKRFNYNHRRDHPTASSTEYSTRVPDSYEHKFIGQHHQTTKLSPAEQPVTTVYPERTGNYKTTDQYHQSTKLSIIEQPVTTVYPERINLQEGTTSFNLINSNHNAQHQSSLQNKTQHHNRFKPNPSRKRTKPTSTTPAAEPLSSTEPTDFGLGLPNDMKNLLISFDVDQLSNPWAPVNNKSEETTLFIASEPTEHSTQYSASEFISERITTQKPVMRDDVKEILASIGLFPDRERQETQSTTTTTTTTTATAVPDIAAAAESFSSEMKDLLISFGLLPSANDIQQVLPQESKTEGPNQAYDQQAASPVVDPSSYLSFKPLPLTVNENKEYEEDKHLISSDMKQFLASFGLVPISDSEEGYPSRGTFPEHGNVHGFRSQKALKTEVQPLTNSTDKEPDHTLETMPRINMDMLTDEMKEILENLGILPPTNISTDATKRTSGSQGHIFNPSGHLASLHPTEQEAQRLTTILDTIKKLMKENETITQNEIDALNASVSFILPPVPVDSGNTTAQPVDDLPVLFVQKKQVNKSVPLHHIKDAPDPLSLEELLLVPDDNKNEVKRQQSNNGTSSNSTEGTTRDQGPSLTDLAASFGGGETAPDDASVDDALPTKKPNGLYFLLDWNTFLDVGEEGSSRRVNLRFSPRLGNSRAFLPVTVP